MGAKRLDQALAKLLPDFSRTQIQQWITNGDITVNSKLLRPKDLVLGGESIIINSSRKAQPEWEAQAIPLEIIYEDDELLVINKPIGIVVHPGSGNTNNTLLNALLHYLPSLQSLPRAGIVHRLDKDTSGLLVIAKTHSSLLRLVIEMKNRRITRIYQAVVLGTLIGGATINAPIDRHPIQRKRMAIVASGRPSITHYRIMEKFRCHTRLKVQLETGRTHQIRVHMASIRHAIIGDQTYGGRMQLPKGASPLLIDTLRNFKRQALHAYELSLTHPVTQEVMTWQAPLPEDMQNLIKVLRDETSNFGKDSDYS
jgi:23S rRNA pseudouridine1911/1915/1917 synthase